MWPFKRRPAWSMPDWQFVPWEDSSGELALRTGRWMITDGAWIRDDSVPIGVVTQPQCTIACTSQEADLAIVKIEYHATSVSQSDCDTCMVVDSGDITICCVEAIEAAKVGRGTAYSVSKAASKAETNTRIVFIKESSGDVVGIVIFPPYGDGTYAISNREIKGDRRLLKINVLDSL